MLSYLRKAFCLLAVVCVLVPGGVIQGMEEPEPIPGDPPPFPFPFPIPSPFPDPIPPEQDSLTQLNFYRFFSKANHYLPILFGFDAEKHNENKNERID